MQTEEGFFGSGKTAGQFSIASESRESGQTGLGTCCWLAL